MTFVSAALSVVSDWWLYPFVLEVSVISTFPWKCSESVFYVSPWSSVFHMMLNTDSLVSFELFVYWDTAVSAFFFISVISFVVHLQWVVQAHLVLGLICQPNEATMTTLNVIMCKLGDGNLNGNDNPKKKTTKITLPKLFKHWTRSLHKKK